MTTAAARTPATRDMRLSYGDGAAYSLMVGFGETYLAAFALALGATQVEAGLLAGVPLIAGGLLQLAAPWGTRAVGSYRRWVVLCAATQAALYLPLTLAALQGALPVWTLFAIAAVYWGVGMATGPAWNNWIDVLIPKDRLREFLATRSRLTQLAAFSAFLIGGLMLQVLHDRALEMQGYVVLFALAGLGRLASAGFLRAQTDVPAPKAPPVPLSRALARFRDPTASRFLLFTLIQTVAVNVGGPFFSPYMLAHVKFSYAEYVVLCSAAYVAKIAFYPYVARFVRRVGAYRALWISGILLSPAPMFWFWTPQLWALVAVQVFAGTAWATFELASTLLVFDRIPADERVRILTLYNMMNAVAVVTGALLGGALLESFPKGVSYHYVFALSAIGRLTSLSVLFGAKRITVRVREVAFRTVGLRPVAGAISQPILSSPDDRKS